MPTSHVENVNNAWFALGVLVRMMLCIVVFTLGTLVLGTLLVTAQI